MDPDLYEGCDSRAALDQVDPLALLGLERHLDIGLALRTPRASAPQLAKSLASLLSEAPAVPSRLAGLGVAHDNVEFTLAITLGTIDQVKAGEPASHAGVALLQRIVTSLAAYEPALVQLPDPESAEAAAARAATARVTTARVDAPAQLDSRTATTADRVLAHLG